MLWLLTKCSSFLLQTVGRYCYLPSTLEKVEKICKAAVGVPPDVPSPVGESAVVPGEGAVRVGADSQDVVAAKVWFRSSAMSIQQPFFYILSYW